MTDDDTETQSFWSNIAAGTKLFTITTTKKVSQMAIKYKNPTHVPGWLIEENGVEILKETANRGSAGRPDPITYTYDFPEAAAETFEYDFIVNVLSDHNFGPAIFSIEMDGVMPTVDQFTVYNTQYRSECSNYRAPNGKCDGQVGFTDDDPNTQSFWEVSKAPVGTKLFTIRTTKKVSQLKMTTAAPQHSPGWIIKEDGVELIKETVNRGKGTNWQPTYTYDFDEARTEAAAEAKAEAEAKAKAEAEAKAKYLEPVMCAFERNWCDCPYGGDVVYGDRRIGFDEIVASGKYKVKPDAARIMCDNGNVGGSGTLKQATVIVQNEWRRRCLHRISSNKARPTSIASPTGRAETAYDCIASGATTGSLLLATIEGGRRAVTEAPAVHKRRSATGMSDKSA